MPSVFRTSESIALGYFAYLIAVAFLKPLPAHQKRRTVAIAILTSATIVALAFSRGSTAAGFREWMPTVYLMIGYWLPARLVTSTNPTLERTLLGFDRQLFGERGLTSFADRAPRLSLELLELAYLFCYPIVPIGFLCLALAGFRALADQYWTTVLLAAFFCYGALPWLPTRAPRAIEGERSKARSSIRRLNVQILNRASVQLNTFPSGHAATSSAIALVVGAHLPVAGALLGVLAVGIAAGSVLGRYHYAADAITGMLVAAAAFAASRLVS